MSLKFVCVSLNSYILKTLFILQQKRRKLGRKDKRKTKIEQQGDTSHSVLD